MEQLGMSRCLMPVQGMKLMGGMNIVFRGDQSLAARRIAHLGQMVLLAISAFAVSCEHPSDWPTESTTNASTQHVRISPNPDNILSAMVTLNGRGGPASVEIIGDSLTEPVTPFYIAGRESTIIPVLGLRPNKTYTLRVIGASSSGLSAAVLASRPMIRWRTRGEEWASCISAALARETWVQLIR